jgi:hypothetical protein
MAVREGGEGPKAGAGTGMSERNDHVDITLLLVDHQYGLSQNSRQRRCVFYSTKVWLKSTFFAWKKATASRHSRHLDVVRRNKAGKHLLVDILRPMF